MPDWKIYRGDPKPDERFRQILYDDRYCPEWRNFPKRHYPDEAGREAAIARSGPLPGERDSRGAAFVPDDDGMIEMVNAALYLRRPLLVTGKPGVGKSSLIYSVARELGLGRVLRWPINSRSSLRDGQYQYDAIGRLQEWQLKKMRMEAAGNLGAEIDIGEYLQLGPLGTAMLPWAHPRALLIDEIDKGDPDLANDLLNVLEEGEFEIPELARLGKNPDYETVEVPTADGGGHTARIVKGVVRCLHFPFVILTSNGERDFPPAFLRRCLQLEVEEPGPEQLWEIVRSHLDAVTEAEADSIIQDFIRLRHEGLRTNDQLLQAVFLLTRDYSITGEDYRKKLLKKLLNPLTR
jgi:MoxR-like ATPase